MQYALNAMSKFIPVMKNAKLNLWRAVYIERCTYGFGARLWKPVLETRQGAVVLAYNLQRESLLEFVMDCLQKNTTEIRNMKQYLLTVLFNAPTTISNHYTSQVNHDLYGGW